MSYHVGVAFQDSDRSYRIRIWDDNASDFLNSDITGNFTNNITIEDAPMFINNLEASETSGFGDCRMDEIVVFKDVLSTSEIDQIRAGTYGAAGGISIPVVMQQMDQFDGGAML